MGRVLLLQTQGLCILNWAMLPKFGLCDGRKWQHTPVFLPVKSHGQRSLAGYSPQGYKESDTTDQAHTHDGLNLRDRVLGEVKRALLLFQAKGSTAG